MPAVGTLANDGRLVATATSCRSLTSPPASSSSRPCRQRQRRRLRELHLPGPGQRRRAQRRRRPRPERQHADHRRDVGQRRAVRSDNTRHRARGHTSHVQRHFGFTDSNDSPANAFRPDPTVAGRRPTASTARSLTAGTTTEPTRPWPTPTATTTASPSRSRTTARPTAASTSTRAPGHADHRRDVGQRRAVRCRQHRHRARGHGLHVQRGRLRLHRSQRQPGQRLRRGQDHDRAGRRHPRQQRGALVAGNFMSVADITAGKLKFTPVANANGTTTRASPSRSRTTAAVPTAASTSTRAPTR